MRTSISSLVVEWDTEKDKINFKKHGISFSTAALVFADKNRVEFYDFTHSVDEDRYMTIGIVNNLLTVIYTERARALRIISARLANATERKIYYGKNR